MTIQRGDVLFPVNTTVVDTAAGIDVRLLSTAQAGATDSSQSVRWTHTQDGTNRCFDPANALVTTVADPLTFQGEGWGLRLTEDHTPPDDTNCNSFLKAGTHTIQLRCLLNMNGGTNLGGVNTFTMKVGLFRYNVVTNTATFIASGTAAQTWNTSSIGAENNVRKDTTISVDVAADVEFGANEVLLLQLGANATTLVDASVGTTNYDLTLDVDDAGTFIDFEGTLGGIGILCRLTDTVTGRGTVPATVRDATMSRSLVGRGTLSAAKTTIASRIFDLLGKGVVTEAHPIQAFRTANLVGEGSILTSGANGSTITIPIDEIPTEGVGGGETIVVKKYYPIND